MVALAAPQSPTSTPFSDDALALEFADRYSDKLRYVAKWGRWLFWNGSDWYFRKPCSRRPSPVGFVAALLPSTRTSTSSPKPIASAKTVAAVETLARDDRRIAATIDQWDADPWLLNIFLRVLLHLQTGDLRPHRAEDYMTKITAVGPGGECPKFFGVHKSHKQKATWSLYLTSSAYLDTR